MSEAAHWDRQYREGDAIWDSDRPVSELVRTLAEERLTPCRAVDLGCGTGADAVWLAGQGFAVSAIDISQSAIERARQRAEQTAVVVRFLCGDLRDAGVLGPPFDFFFDCGCYGAMQRSDAPGYLRALERLTRSGTHGLVLAGNDHEPEDRVGPPVLSRQKVLTDFGRLFDVLRLREFRFDADRGEGKRYLGWSCLLRRR
jgi:SAM-dependent methyltransferase